MDRDEELKCSPRQGDDVLDEREVQRRVAPAGRGWCLKAIARELGHRAQHRAAVGAAGRGRRTAGDGSAAGAGGARGVGAGAVPGRRAQR